jgi:hypothetical protein
MTHCTVYTRVTDYTRMYKPLYSALHAKEKAVKNALIKNKIKFSSYIRKFRRERVQSHI